MGYWLWDPQDKQVLRCFIVPRGVSVIAGGSAAEDTQLEIKGQTEIFHHRDRNTLQRVS